MALHPVGIPYQQFQPRDSFDAIVIGSGIGGMGAAALLAKAAGWRVLVLERHYTAGGFTHTFHRPGYEWDVGVHYVGQVHGPDASAAALFDYLTEGRLSWQPMPDVYDTVDIDGRRFDFVAGRARLQAALDAAFPAERPAVGLYFEAVEACNRWLAPFFVEKTLPTAIARLIGTGLRAPFLRYARQTTRQVLDGIGCSRRLQAVLTSQWGNYGLPPGQSSFAVHAIVARHYFEGAGYPVGGASRIAASLLPAIERAGGQLVVTADVEQIVVEQGRAVGVRLKDGTRLRARTIISDAGIHTTMDRLLAESGSPEVDRLAARLRRLPASTGHLCLYVGLTATPMLRQLAGTNRWIHPGVDFDANLAAYTADENAAFPFVYISCASAKDPTFQHRYPDRWTMEVVTVAPYDRFTQWTPSRWKHRGAGYEAMKQRLGERLLAELYRHVPATEGAVDTWELSTPLSTQHFANAERGAMYGLAHTPARFGERGLGPRTPIPHLFLTGQDVAVAGVMGALSGAVTAASAILGRSLFGAMAGGMRRPSMGRRENVAPAAN
jgi:all-trans-retinol 13,14-reductase